MVMSGADVSEETLLFEDFRAWLDSEDSEPNPLESSWPYIRIEAEDLVVAQLERLAEFRSRAQDDNSWWIDAIRSAHLCLTAAMVTALEGTAGIGAMRPKAAKKTLEWLNSHDRQTVPMPREETLSFLELLDSIQQPGRLDCGSVVSLDNETITRAKELNWFRELIDHPKFTRWSVPIQDVDDASALPFDLIEQLINCVPQRYEAGARDRVTVALGLHGNQSIQAAPNQQNLK